MKSHYYSSRFTLFVASLFVLSMTFMACGNDKETGGLGPAPEANIVEVAAENGNFDILVQAIQDAGLAETLQQEGPVFTVFAPTDDAFEALPEGTLESLTPEQLAEILQFHVINGEIESGDLAASQDVETLLGEEILVEADGGVLVNGYSNVVTADVEAANGIIHAVDAVLLPEGYRDANIIDQAVELGNFTTLASAVEQVGLTSTLKYKGDFTVFAPTDDAFAALPEGLLGSLSNAQLTDILTYHVLSGEVFAGDLSAEQAVESLQGGDVYITSDGTNVNVNGSASVVAADVDVSNGVIHAIDEVILPNEFLNIVHIASKNYDLSTLVTLVADNGLVPTLEGDGPFTVFAPTNAAFEAVSDVLSTLSPSEVSDVLTYHVAAQEILSGDLPAPGTATSVPTVLGDDITVAVDVEGNVTLNGSVNVTTVDIQGSNGVIHIIDGVLLPNQDANLVDTATNAGLTTLLDAVGAVNGLGQALLDQEAITVFAPTNDAFADALAAYGVSSLSELVTELGGLDNLETVLGFHVVPAVAFSGDLSEGSQTFTTLAGQDLTVTRTGADVTVTDAAGNTSNVVTADVAIENGVVHVIDSVLLPEITLPDAVEAATDAGLTTLIDALVAAELADAVTGAEAITVFAPTNAAFDDLLAANNVSDLDGLINELGAQAVSDVLTYHVVPAVAFSHDLNDGDTFTTLQGEELTVNISGSGVTVEDVNGNIYNVTATDVAIENGVVHVIDGVLLPTL